jgi:ankyrin repeat protein
MSLLPPPPQDDDIIITQFKPLFFQWELNDEKIKRIDPQSGETILHNYCNFINTTPLDVYMYLIQTKGCDVNMTNVEGNTALFNAFLYFRPNYGGNITALTYLLHRATIKANHQNRQGRTLLHAACQNLSSFSLDIFKFLIEKLGGDLSIRDERGLSPIHEALSQFRSVDNSVAVLTYLLSQKGVNINSPNGSTLFHLACQNVNKLPLDVFKFLIENKGADMNVLNSLGDTPVYNAVYFFNKDRGGCVDVLVYLLSHENFNVYIKDRYGRTSIHLACSRDIPEEDDDEENDHHVGFEFDTFWSQTVQVIVERCMQQVFDEAMLR